MEATGTEWLGPPASKEQKNCQLPQTISGWCPKRTPLGGRHLFAVLRVFHLDARRDNEQVGAKILNK